MVIEVSIIRWHSFDNMSTRANTNMFQIQILEDIFSYLELWTKPIRMWHIDDCVNYICV